MTTSLEDWNQDGTEILFSIFLNSATLSNPASFLRLITKSFSRLLRQALRALPLLSCFRSLGGIPIDIGAVLAEGTILISDKVGARMPPRF